MRKVHADNQKRKVEVREEEEEEEETRQNMVVHAARSQPDLETGNKKADAPTFECHVASCMILE